MLSADDEIRLKEVVAETLGVDSEEIDSSTSSETLPAWTSFVHLTVMSAVEETFGLTFSMEEMTGVKSFGDLSALVARRL